MPLTPKAMKEMQAMMAAAAAKKKGKGAAEEKPEMKGLPKGAPDPDAATEGKESAHVRRGRGGFRPPPVVRGK